MSLELKQLQPEDTAVMEVFYDWKKHETHLERFTCRPVKPLNTLDEYKETMKNVFKSGNITYYLTNRLGEVLGRIVLFDINPRNRSAEFGYYCPSKHRGQGYGTEMVRRFIDEVFQNTELNLNRIYATTASGNIGSIRLLEKFHFKLEGTMREHYWFEDAVQDQFCYGLLRREWSAFCLSNTRSGDDQTY